MLLEIRCDEFKDQDAVRPPIQFKKGLNVILGASRASNSIGKSTFLMVIDFVFGGKDYVTLNNDVVRNVGTHEIQFVFQFEGKKYYFARSTGDHTKVWECDEQFNHVNEISIETYCGFLAKQYGMEDLGSTFRDLVSGFFRIYGRGNYNEKTPLRAFHNDTMEDGIRRLLQLFGRYGRVGELSALVNDATDKESTYKKAYSYSYIRGVSRKTEYEENEKRIQELEQQKQEMAQGNRRDLLDMDSVQAARLAELKRQIANLKRQRRRLTSQISAMRADVEIDDSSFYRDYNDLLEFFPDVDIRHITEIDDFHRKLKKVLRDEYKENEGKLNDTVELLDIQIALLEQEADAINATPSLSQAVLDGYAEIDREIRNRQAANEFYVKKDELQTTREELQGRLDKLIGELTRELQTDINIRLKQLNDTVCMGRKTAPHLAIQGAKKYEYAIPNDIGTGSLTRGLFLFDIVCAEMTPLPAVIHDSMSVKQVEDPVMLKILELYQQSDKQFFVAIDKGESYSDDRKIPDVIKNAIRLRLSPGHELFGRPWNEVTEENKEEKPEE